VVLSAASTPCCFPAFAALGSALGLGFLEPFESEMQYVFQASALLSFGGAAMTFRRNRRWIPLALAFMGALAIIYAFNVSFEEPIIYAGMGGLMFASILNVVERIQTKTTASQAIQTRRVITCPHCSFRQEEEMPTNACQYFYQCTHCSTVLRPKEGDCCVYCSYGTVHCPPIQAGADCCS
jgi:hypothetical protein